MQLSFLQRQLYVFLVETQLDGLKRMERAKITLLSSLGWLPLHVLSQEMLVKSSLPANYQGHLEPYVCDILPPHVRPLVLSINFL